MTTQPIPEELARHHGGTDAEWIGASWAETFELHGGLRSDQVVLDIGCGPGRMAVGIGQRFHFSSPSYLGFDITRPEIDWCTENITGRYPHFKFVHLDIYNGHYNPGGTMDPASIRFPAEDGASEFIFATSVFTHMRTPEMLAYLREARRCLAPNGHFFATFLCLEEDFQGRMMAERNFSTPVDAHSYTSRPANPEDAIAYRTSFVEQSFAELGFKTRFYRGAWSRLVEPTGRHSQDYFVASL